MNNMTAAEMKNTARMNTIALLMPVLEENNAIKFGDGSFAIRQEVAGQTIWTSVEVKSKAYKATKTYEAFDPIQAAADWEEEKRLSAEKRAAKEAEKARKLATKG